MSTGKEAADPVRCREGTIRRKKKEAAAFFLGMQRTAV